MMDQPPKKPNAGGAKWLVTFADLMALLMCFFVLLLSFSEMDVQKYKEVAGSMANAFGVQRKVPANEPPMGTSFVAKEFSPGQPSSKPISVIENLAMWSPLRVRRGRPSQDEGKDIAERIRQGLAREIELGLVQVVLEPDRVIVRIRERASFPSGSAELLQPFRPTMAKIGEILNSTTSRIVVAGHTDSFPISNARYRSNWELSSARAVTVIHELLRSTSIPPSRFVLEGYADVRPIASNDTAKNRALNRRVELIVERDSRPLPDSESETAHRDGELS